MFDEHPIIVKGCSHVCLLAVHGAQGIRVLARLEVISGRHRLDDARKSGATRIMCYVYAESEARDVRWARTFDLEQNIRDFYKQCFRVAGNHRRKRLVWDTRVPKIFPKDRECR